MKLNGVSKAVLDCAFKVQTALGPGLLESVYEAILAYELLKHGLAIARQVAVQVRYEALKFDEGHRIDLLVEHLVIAELKSVEHLAPVHSKQLLTQLRRSGRQVGLLINFGEVHLKQGISRIVNNYSE